MAAGGDHSEGFLDGRRGTVVRLKPGEAAPAGAVPVNPFTVAMMRHKALLKKPSSENWAFRYGPYVVAAFSWLSGAVVTYSMRQRLRLFGPTARLMNYVGAIMGPAILSGLTHEVLRNQMLTEVRDCPICLPTRSACVNVISGWLIPSLSGFIATAHIARQNNSYPVPRLNEFKALTQTLSKLSYKHRPAYAVTFCLSVAVPFALTYVQQVEVGNVRLERHVPLEDEITLESSKWDC